MTILSNLSNQAEFMNTISNCENDMDEGHSELDEALEDPIAKAIKTERVLMHREFEQIQLYKTAIALLERCRNESLPFFLNREIDALLASHESIK